MMHFPSSSNQTQQSALNLAQRWEEKAEGHREMANCFCGSLGANRYREQKRAERAARAKAEEWLQVAIERGEV